mmetsp:Transcript_6494/g.10329  ORF Transcript_6494/g.10329 Transcript_6494/m.10329 type:complete len:105 (+) Transcript_6494:2081-2395(+)
MSSPLLVSSGAIETKIDPLSLNDSELSNRSRSLGEVTTWAWHETQNGTSITGMNGCSKDSDETMIGKLLDSGQFDESLFCGDFSFFTKGVWHEGHADCIRVYPC